MATIPLVITLKDYVYRKDITIPTGIKPPITPGVMPPLYVPPAPTAAEQAAAAAVLASRAAAAASQAAIPPTGGIGYKVLKGSLQARQNPSSPITGNWRSDLTFVPAVWQLMAACNLKTIDGYSLQDERWCRFISVPGLPNPNSLPEGTVMYIGGTCPTGSIFDAINKVCKSISAAPTPPAPVFGVTPPSPPGRPTPTPSPTGQTRIVTILPADQTRLPDANEGETINITASVICKAADGSITKPSDTTFLIIDGAIADRKPTSNGLVTFEWQATAVPISIHTICVSVEPSASCNSPGEDCKRITVSPIALSAAAQLAKERASEAEQRRLLEQARAELRGQIVSAPLGIPGTSPTGLPYVSPALTIPPAPTAPTVPTAPTAPTVPAVPETGDIQIISIPGSLMPISPDLPLYVYVDNNNVGRLYELPKTVTGQSIGAHSVFIRAGNITTPIKTVYVRANQTTTVSL